MYKVNSRKLRNLIQGLGEGGIARTALGAMISVSTLEKMICGTYRSTPRQALRMRLSEFFNVPESELFEVVKNRKESA